MRGKILLVLAAAGAAAVSLLFAVGALADDHGRHGGTTLLRSGLAPTVPTDDTIHGVRPGGVPWVIDDGRVRLRSDGRLDIVVRGLVVPPGNTNPVATLSASLFCGDDTVPAAATGTVPFSPDGDAKIDAELTLPEKCLGATIVLNPNGVLASYIAASGFGG